LENGWFHFYKPYLHFESTPSPIMSEGQKAEVKRMVLENKFTKPPPRYNPSSLLKKMEKEEIGTKATRAGIIQTLQSRKYIREERMVVTPLGLEVIDILKKYSPTVVSIELTRKLEEKMQKIRRGKEIRENVLLESMQFLKPIIKKLKENEQTIGARLTQALKEVKLEESIISVCPVCRDGNLLILRSKRTGKRFIGCTNYFEDKCKNSYPLPQKGLVKPTGTVCKSCGWPTLRIWTKGKRSWNLCFNPQCGLKGKGTKDPELQSM
jgi:DNA topoisomerase-1